MTEYVAGFMFSEFGTKVALIQKERPEWQKGNFNAIGGHIEEGEIPLEAMCREFVEETGVSHVSWEQFLVYRGIDYVVYFFVTFSDDIYYLRTITDETIQVLSVYDIQTKKVSNIIPNLYWLIPLALDKSISYAWVDEVVHANK
jgi:8-oxo-dGTP diphosphatase